ncbi:MAG: DNA polymerase III subunit delta [Paludibacteraceae bacterium]|nr:DNA polymerase III subunit delta [Paludibacteraceae bacterium]
MRYCDIIGQEDVKKLIIKNIRDGRIPHAQLFWGGEGVGKLALAIATVQYINCEHPTDTDSCGECESCRLIAKLSHPDLHFMFPIVKEGSKSAYCDDFMPQWREQMAETPYFNLHQWMQRINESGKIGYIYTTESEAISQKLSLKSFSAKYKSTIIWLPERMQETAANKLLKILEEPPADTLFFLVSEHPEQLLTTITSRTQALRIKNIDRKSLMTVFPEDISRLSGGNYIKAKELLDSEGATAENVTRYRNLMVYVFKRDLVSLKEFADESAASRENCIEFLNYACHLTREAFIANLCNANLIYRSASEVQFTENFKKFITETNIESILDLFTKAAADIERNGNIKLIMFDLGINLMTLIKKQ